MEYKFFEEEMVKQLKGLQIELKEEQMQAFYKYMNMLIEKNKVMNLTGITEPKEIILKHFIDSLTISKYIANNKRVIDIGTGAGFPGIPLKIQNSTLEMCLLDSLNKRINFLKEFTKIINLTKIQSIHGRAEEYGKNKEYREFFDVAVSRAVAPLNVLLEYMLPFVKLNGKCICMKGNITDEELNDSKNAIKILGGEIERIEKFTLSNTDNNRTIILVKKTKTTPSLYPRNPGTPSKKPL